MTKDHANIPTLIKRILEELDTKHEAYGFVMELAAILNQTKKCDRCSGKGTHPRHYNCGHGAHDAFVRGCNESIMCKKCHGDTRLPL